MVEGISFFIGFTMRWFRDAFCTYEVKKAEELGVSGQTLLIVSGDIKINITNEAFMYARSKPEKLKQVIKEKIDPLL